MQKIDGNKTYIICVLMICVAFGLLAARKIDITNAIILIGLAAEGMGLRSGIKKCEYIEEGSSEHEKLRI